MKRLNLTSLDHFFGSVNKCFKLLYMCDCDLPQYVLRPELSVKNSSIHVLIQTSPYGSPSIPFLTLPAIIPLLVTLATFNWRVWASTWLCCLERRFGAGVLRNLTYSSPVLPTCFYQYNSPSTVNVWFLIPSNSALSGQTVLCFFIRLWKTDLPL